MAEVDWPGKSGKTYKYSTHTLGTRFKELPGNYIYAKETEPRHWSPLYIGQASSLRDRLADHEKEACAVNNGAKHVHAHTSAKSENNRLAEETDLIAKWNPTCNG